MRSTPLNRVAAVLAGAVLGLTALANPAGATGNHGTNEQTGTGDRHRCTTVEKAEYKHWFDGKAGTASIELTNGPLCSGEQAFSLVSYTAPSATFSTPQYVLDQSTQTFKAPDSKNELTPNRLDFKVEVPECFAQVDFVFGKDVIPVLTDKGDRYNERKVGSQVGTKHGSKKYNSTAAEGQPQNAWANFGSGTCVAEPVVEASSDCDGNVVLTLINRSTHSATFEITADGGFTQTEKLAVRAQPKPVDIPAANAKNIVVTSGGKEIYRGGWTKPEDCQVPEVGTPEAKFASSCEGLTFTITNPENGKPVTATFTPNTGAAQTLTVEPGQTTPAFFPASEGLKVVVTGDLDVLNGEVAWTKPADCVVTPPSEGTPSDSPSETPSESPSATPSESVSESASPSVSTSSSPVATTPVSDTEDGGSLPVTGAAAGGIAGGAALLLVVGAGLFFMARRRKLNFKA
ncbi:hypothetical protein AB0F72_23450 [Actinoplanes sp. NPDC023936]|uniref:hypothetical protein n=1 Tax=Actinoplanes sp. NPDC023936 TaxID=3154910 RepID=UPI0033F03344